MDDANYGDMNDMYTAILSKDIYLWWHAIEEQEAKMLKQLKSDGIVHA